MDTGGGRGGSGAGAAAEAGAGAVPVDSDSGWLRPDEPIADRSPVTRPVSDEVLCWRDDVDGAVAELYHGTLAEVISLSA